jgi:predicted nucleotidyltransferase
MAESREVRQKAPGALVLDPHIEEQLKDVTGRIVEALAPQRIILFGSHAYGQPNSDSDVDLLVVMESDERPAARATRVSRLLRPRPFPMDIVVRTPQEIQERLAIGDYFMREVIRHYHELNTEK